MARRKIVKMETLEQNFIYGLLRGVGSLLNDAQCHEMLKRNPKVTNMSLGAEVSLGEGRRVLVEYEVDRDPSHPADQQSFLSCYNDLCREHGLCVDVKSVPTNKPPLRLLEDNK